MSLAINVYEPDETRCYMVVSDILFDDTQKILKKTFRHGNTIYGWWASDKIAYHTLEDAEKIIKDLNCVRPDNRWAFYIIKAQI